MRRISGSNDIRSPKEIETLVPSIVSISIRGSNDIRSPKEIETFLVVFCGCVSLRSNDIRSPKEIETEGSKDRPDYLDPFQ